MAWIMDMITQYGYFAIFALLALGIIGIPVPDEILMLFVGYLCSVMVLDFSISVLVCFIGAVTGMLTSYTLGKKLGQPLVDKHGKWIGLTTKRFEIVKRWFAKFGLWTILLGYFVPGLRHATSYISGISAMPFRKYFLTASLGSLVWVLVFTSIGYYMGANISFAGL
ncbi:MULTISPECIES: DedA family protein [Paenibacillus]|uniref:DedA family protein n=1 Tax=Paenibacillus agri TaxID=2744309 RepID=A0A850EHJ3_9BACL|nr:DedA family protein [Paenibacillus agri]NUU59340.1 DedA family protein [Paenibacillus agri]